MAYGQRQHEVLLRYFRYERPYRGRTCQFGLTMSGFKREFQLIHDLLTIH